MREILFRGKRVDGGEWMYGAFCPKSCDLPFGPMVDRPSIIKLENPCSGYWADVIPDTVGQYTGLTDKNGKRIFEGDIVAHHVQGEILVNYGPVIWDGSSGKWCQQLNTMHPDFSLFNTKAFEVIGNIHDNPELMGGADNG